MRNVFFTHAGTVLRISIAFNFVLCCLAEYREYDGRENKDN